MVKESKRVTAKTGSLDLFLKRCNFSLSSLYETVVQEQTDLDHHLTYKESTRLVIQMLAVLVASEQMNEIRQSSAPIKTAARVISDAALKPAEGCYQSYLETLQDIHCFSGYDIFAPRNVLDVSDSSFSIVASALLYSLSDAPIETIYFQTIPLSWLGSAYQSMLALRPSESGETLESSHSQRKKSGTYYTPSCLITYIIESVLTPLVESALNSIDKTTSTERIVNLKLLDPSMGGGDFLTRAIDFLCESMLFGKGDSDGQCRAQVAACCVYGVDVDPAVVEIARFCVWASSMYADGISSAIKAHLICRDALGADEDNQRVLDYASDFPEVFVNSSRQGFDAVVGNPPYIASKNGLILADSRASTMGQSDSYLAFLTDIIENGLVRNGGMFSMVLPDPMLVRGNAAAVRRKFTSDWTIQSILHISGIFPDAQVANIVPICKRAVSGNSAFLASRIERAADRRNFMLRPRRTALQLAHPVRKETVLAQDRCEFLYLLEDGAFGNVIRRIHGDNLSLTNFQPPFVPLRKLNVKSIYRGEEIGKSAINKGSGDFPILLGGQSIRPYEIVWEGCRINQSRIKKPIARYMSSKILIQKSSAHIIAALDELRGSHFGYVFPQSVYAVELLPDGMHELYLLCILNSRVINEYVRRTVTGYKLLQPQLELEDIRALPIRSINFTTSDIEREEKTAQGVNVFRQESLRAGEISPFSELANFVVQCLEGTPERSDVVHDILVHLGRIMADLTTKNRKSPDAETTRRMEYTRAAIETVVYQLYSSEPSQMGLPW